MDNLLQTGGAGGFGAVLGALMSFFGIKGKINDVDKRIDNLAGVVQFASTCDARYESLKGDISSSKDMQKEMRDDIKAILEKV